MSEPTRRYFEPGEPEGGKGGAEEGAAAAPAARSFEVSWRSVLPLAAALALAAGIAAAVWLMARPIALLLIAITIGEALMPIVRFFNRWLPRVLSVVIVYALLIAVFVALFSLVLPSVAQQVTDILNRLPQMLDRTQAWFQRWEQWLGADLQKRIAASLSQVGGQLIQLPLSLLNAAFDLLVLLFLSVYWVIEAPSIRDFAVSMVPPGRQKGAADVLQRMGSAMGGYVRGAGIDGAIMGALTWVALSIVGLQYALVLAVITAVGELVPYLGPWLAGALAVVAAYLQSTTSALLVLGIYVALQQFEGHILTPNIMRTQTDLPAGLVLFAFVAGWAVGGFLGAIAAIPLAAALRVATLTVVVPRVRAETGGTSERSARYRLEKD